MNAYNRLPKNYLLDNRYRIQKPIGNGHSAVVYEALDVKTGTGVAVKVLDPLMANDPEAFQRFHREVEILSRLKHPCITTIYDVFQTEGTWAISMELARGLDAKSWIKKNGPMGVGHFLKVADQILDALSCCHEKGVVHRDIKPQNIMIGQDLGVKLLDFGISKLNAATDLTKTGTSLGTPEYMAPEMFVAVRKWDPRVDIYSTGLVFYELIAGRPAFRGNSLWELFALHKEARREPVSYYRPDLPSWVESVVEKCLRVDPDERYQTAYEVASELKKKMRARAYLEHGVSRSRCTHCGTPLIRSLPFCHNCGVSSEGLYEQGEWCLVVQACENAPEAAKLLGALHRNVDTARLSKLLARPPAVLLRNVSQETASRVANDLSQFPCKVAMDTSLPAVFSVPRQDMLMAGGAALVFGLVSGLALGLIPGIVNATAGWAAGVFGLFKARSQPLIRPPESPARKKGETPLYAKKFAQLVRNLQEARSRATMGRILAGYFRLRRGLTGSEEFKRELDTLEQIMVLACEAMAMAEEMASALSGVSLTALKDDRDRLDLRIAREKDPDEIARMLEMKQENARQGKMYHEMEEQYAALVTAVVQLNGFVRRFEDSAVDMSRSGLAEQIFNQLDSRIKSARAI